MCIRQRRPSMKYVMLVNQAGKLWFVYAGPLSTSDCENDRIHFLDQDGQFICFVNCNLNSLFGLCAVTNENIFVAEWAFGDVKKSNITNEHVVFITVLVILLRGQCVFMILSYIFDISKHFFLVCRKNCLKQLHS